MSPKGEQTMNNTFSLSFPTTFEKTNVWQNPGPQQLYPNITKVQNNLPNQKGIFYPKLSKKKIINQTSNPDIIIHPYHLKQIMLAIHF
jgi:hypothetical protein